MLNNDSQLDQMFQALADGNRRAMIDRLAKQPLSVSALAKPMTISLPAVMQHLAVLEQCGIVRTEKVGRVRTCTLDTTALSRAEQWIAQRRQFWNGRLDALGAFLDQEETSHD